ncbi:hypothetical protein LTR66_007106 [Elasticomyces elasticus]|nr:hypothetical protein LTR28_008051 [Elasticomyces elasticus]KAK4985927.1 hypothetical protein LTR50_005653 [Elasticomyces elasticus]KAK4989232.1 hypothetical protein LTR66_007106 [Elasticomyces elasticus]
MRSLAVLLFLPLSLLPFVSALPTAIDASPLPLLIWHGLGDRYDAKGLAQTAKLAQIVHPGTLVYNIRVDEDGSADRTATFLGNLTEQLDKVCKDISSNASLNKTAGRVDALGFSQGGQFLRGLVQRCDGLEVRSLVTFGSQHNGIAEFQVCGAWDLVCRGAVGLVKGNAWTKFIQNKVVPAQYYREVDPDTGLGSEAYLNNSNFLADVNNERANKNDIYKKRIASLEKFVMYVFENDTTVIPKESGWFAEVNATTKRVTPLRERTMYEEDWLGLKALYKKNGLVFRTAPDAHMELNDKVLSKAFREFFGPERAVDVVFNDKMRGIMTGIGKVQQRLWRYQWR